VVTVGAIAAALGFFAQHPKDGETNRLGHGTLRAGRSSLDFSVRNREKSRDFETLSSKHNVALCRLLVFLPGLAGVGSCPGFTVGGGEFSVLRVGELEADDIGSEAGPVHSRFDAGPVLARINRMI
jgi:hypothetical protein